MIKIFADRTTVVFLALVVTLGVGLREVYAQSRDRRGSLSVNLAPSIGKSDAEKKILAVLNDMDRNQRSILTVPTEDARLLRLLTEAINAKHVVELGTANGYSGIWFALALQATVGKLTTFEIDPQRVKQARENFKRAGVDHLITLVQGDAHEEMTQLTGLLISSLLTLTKTVTSIT